MHFLLSNLLFIFEKRSSSLWPLHVLWLLKKKKIKTSSWLAKVKVFAIFFNSYIPLYKRKIVKVLPAKRIAVSSLRHGDQGVCNRSADVGAHDDGNSHLDCEYCQRTQIQIKPYHHLSMCSFNPSAMCCGCLKRFILTAWGDHADNYRGGGGWALDEQGDKNTNDQTSQRVRQNGVLLKDIACCSAWTRWTRDHRILIL